MEGGADVGGTARGTTPERRYRRTAARADVEAPEVRRAAPRRRGRWCGRTSASTRTSCGCASCWAPPRRAALSFEQESAMRAAALSAWGDRIKAGACEAFYVRIDKQQTAREKQAIGAATEARLAAVQAAHGCTRAGGAASPGAGGPWGAPGHAAPGRTAGWRTRARPPLSRPRRSAGSRGATRRKTKRGTRSSWTAMRAAGLGAVDRHFMQVRYALNALDRARVSGQRHGRRDGPVSDDKWGRVSPVQSRAGAGAAGPAAL